MTEATGTLIVRQTFLNRAAEVAATLSIEILDATSEPSPWSAERLDDGLKQASTLVAGAAMLFAKWAGEWQQHANQLPLFDVEKSNRAGGDPNIRYYHSYWRLAAGQALVIKTPIIECEHWNFQLNNYWLESLDYRYHQITLNKGSATLNSDGSVTLIIAHDDPQHPNWIETAKHREGTMSFRWIRASEHPQPETLLLEGAQLEQFMTSERQRLGKKASSL